ncbi:hypothetical protein MIMGU_mgv1a018526mg [Erythranthe guttata]|nr:hypothetical protein MIMGU_mgv1a018526mg [Erythranthe guttata]
MADTCSLPANWEVNVVFNIFLYNQISGNYLSSPGRTRCFLETKSEWDPSNGYLVNDNIVFDAEVFVVKKDAIIECVSLNNINIHYKHDFMISDFSKLNERFFSEQFIAGATSYWFSASINSWGWPTCIELATINDPNKGFIVNDCCLLSIDIHVQDVANTIN